MSRCSEQNVKDISHLASCMGIRPIMAAHRPTTDAQRKAKAVDETAYYKAQVMR